MRRIRLFFYRATVYCIFILLASCSGGSDVISECGANASCAPPDDISQNSLLVEPSKNYATAQNLIGSVWVVDVFYSSDGAEFRSEDGIDWDVTFVPQTDFGAEAALIIDYPCETRHSIPFTLNDGIFIAVTGPGVASPDLAEPCEAIEPDLAITYIDIMFLKGQEFGFEELSENMIQLSSIENDVLVFRLQDADE